MRISKSVNSFITMIAFDEADLVTDHQTRYYGVPKDYRSDDNPQDGDPSCCYRHSIDGLNTPESKAYLEALNLMSQAYWKILADDAETTYEANK